MPEVTIRIDVVGDVATLHWNTGMAPGDLAAAVASAADDALERPGIRRCEAQVLEGEWPARRALQRAGFRLEGVRRDAHMVDGVYCDVLEYARLDSDDAYGPGAFSAVMNTVLPTKRVISHVVFTDAQHRVLLLQTTYKRDYELPGGVVEPGEPPRDGAQREVAEEIGLVVNLATPALVDWMPPHLGWSDAIEFIYDGGHLDAHAVNLLRLDPGEVVRAHWLGADALDGAVSELSARRIREVLAARGSAQVVFTENGHRR
ncbi:NUDIX hydrolase [Propionibacteriaceae bacterium G1746]|uniref:NUDIX hydrolase n=1 Tax=Aestuariimicrobium sp. G57 TaxID=3418485 RepID=UPI003C1CF099